MTNNKQQTVVDRIVNLLNKEGFAPVLTEEEIKSFKEMEKEQIEEAYKRGWDSGDFGSDCWEEIYYNEIYGGNK
jgi:hypothetical protein